VQIELDYVFIDTWDYEFASVTSTIPCLHLHLKRGVIQTHGKGKPYIPLLSPDPAKIIVDGKVEWRQPHSFTNPSAVGRVCGGGLQDDLAHIVIRLPAHTSRQLTLTARADLNTPGRDESFGISNVRIGPIQPGWPEIAPFADSDVHGWVGGAAKLFLCGTQGRILGGPGNGGALSALSRRQSSTSTAQIRRLEHALLPQHFILLVSHLPKPQSSLLISAIAQRPPSPTSSLFLGHMAKRRYSNHSRRRAPSVAGRSTGRR
jgi:hypothetical protein